MIKHEGIMLNQIVSQTKGNIVSDMGGEKVMLNIEKGKYFNLGELGSKMFGI